MVPAMARRGPDIHSLIGMYGLDNVLVGEIGGESPES